MESANELVIRSEQDFASFILCMPFKARMAVARQLVNDYGSKVLSLVKQLIATKPFVAEIPLLQPPVNPESLNADGGDPNPAVVNTPLIHPPTDSSRRYLARSLGLTMACSLVMTGVKEALPLLLEQINHPSSVGKKQVSALLASYASDDEILAVTCNASQETIHRLADALISKRRRPLAFKIRGMPLPVFRAQTPITQLLENLGAQLQASGPVESRVVWAEYSTLIRFRRSKNSPFPSDEKTNGQIKDSILKLQELYPALCNWNQQLNQGDPTLPDIIVDNLYHFLTHDVQRTMKIIKQTIWRRVGGQGYAVCIPWQLWSGRVQEFWNSQDGMVLKDFYTYLIGVDNGELVMRGMLPCPKVFQNCRTPVVDSLGRLALALLQRDEFSLVPSNDDDLAKTSARIDPIISFAVSAIENLAQRSLGCSMSEAKVEPAQVVYLTTCNLLRDTLRCVIPVLKRFHSNQTELVDRIKSTMLNKLVGEYFRCQAHATGMFPQLALVVFEEIRPFFDVPERIPVSLSNIADNLLVVLQPASESVYDIRLDMPNRPFSSMPPWDNEEVFNVTVLQEFERTQGTEAGLFDHGFSTRLRNFGLSLKQSQRNNVATWLIEGSGLHTVLAKKISHFDITSLFGGVLSDPEMRHRFIYPFIFGDLKGGADLKDECQKWAAYLDIRDAETRALMVKEASKASFADRLKWMAAILEATRRSGSVREWIETLKWLLPRIRNEIQPNLLQLVPYLTPSDYSIPRQYLDKATIEEAGELVKLYSTMDAQNTSAVSPLGRITEFLETLAVQAMNRFIHNPSHPFFQFGTDILWRQSLSRHGATNALENYDLRFDEPCYGCDDHNEQEELERRRWVVKSRLEDCDGQRRLIRVPDGQEEALVQTKLAIFQKRWLEVKDAVMAAQQLDPKEGDDSLEIGQPAIWSKQCSSLIRQLGWRWERSSTLRHQVERWMEILELAKKKICGADEVLDWRDGCEVSSASDFMEGVFAVYKTPYWLQLNGDKLEIYGRYMSLKLRSTSNQAVVDNERRFFEDKEFRKKTRRTLDDLYLEWLKVSKSAILVPGVLRFLMTKRQDLLTDEIISATTTFSGIFNQTTASTHWDIFISHPDRLTPHQCELLKKRYRTGLLDSTRAFSLRISHAEAFVKLPVITIADVSDILVLSNLPSRIAEALLMFLPNLNEPASALQVLLAPVYLQSHLARTAIYAVKNALQHVHHRLVADFIAPLFPPPGGKRAKVTVQKEALRLVCGSMKLFASDTTQALVKRLWSRADLHRDVRSVLIQQLIGLLVSEEATEGAFASAREMAWCMLSEAARNKDWCTEGITMALLAVSPMVCIGQSRGISVSHGLHVQVPWNTALSQLSRVTIPSRLVDEYVDRVLLPMTEGLGEGGALVESRMMTYYILINTAGWITCGNAAALARRWGKELSEFSEHLPALRILLVIGLAHCVHPEAQHAMANGTQATVAWGALIKHVRELAVAFKDMSNSRNSRLRYLQRIWDLKLDHSLICYNSSTDRKAAGFAGHSMDLVQPLLDAGLESLFWTMMVTREISALELKPEWTQDIINEEAHRILLRIVALSNKYLSDIEDVKTLVERLLNKADRKKQLWAYIGRKLLTPLDSDLTSWVHLDAVALMTLNKNGGLFELQEVSALIERVANHGADNFYRTNSELLGILLAKELDIHEQRRREETNEHYLKLFREVLQPIVDRAQRSGWKHGPDASLLRAVTHGAWPILSRAFIDLSGEMLHYNIERSLEISVSESSLQSLLCSFLSSVLQMIKDHRMTPLESYQCSESAGISPARVLVIEALMNGKLASLKLSGFLNRKHDMSPDVMFGNGFVLKPSPISEVSDDADRAQDEHQIPLSMKDMEKHWESILDAS
ncbi:hypothetical protein DFQ26_005111, partial [Actinomortierella ambigua]